MSGKIIEEKSKIFISFLLTLMPLCVIHAENAEKWYQVVRNETIRTTEEKAKFVSYVAGPDEESREIKIMNHRGETIMSNNLGNYDYSFLENLKKGDTIDVRLILTTVKTLELDDSYDNLQIELYPCTQEHEKNSNCATDLKLKVNEVRETGKIIETREAVLEYIAYNEDLKPMFVQFVNENKKSIFMNFSAKYLKNIMTLKKGDKIKVRWKAVSDTFSNHQKPVFTYDLEKLDVKNIEENGKTIFYNHAISGLKMRSKPDFNSVLLQKIPYGEKIEVSEITAVRGQVLGIQGDWVKTKYKNQNGYVFNGFISRYPVPRLNDIKNGIAEYANFQGFNAEVSENSSPYEYDASTTQTITFLKATPEDVYLILRAIRADVLRSSLPRIRNKIVLTKGFEPYSVEVHYEVSRNNDQYIEKMDIEILDVASGGSSEYSILKDGDNTKVIIIHYLP